MREPTIARNYAAALFAAGEASGDTERFAHLMEGLAGAIEADVRIRVVLESPRVSKPQKVEILSAALRRHAPERFLRFLAAVVRRGRQGILPAIGREYLALVDAKFNRVHAGVTFARETDRTLQAAVRAKLGEVLGKEVIPHFRTDPSILGGLIVRVGDRIMDGSLRRRMVALRQKLLNA